jgi:hypothetical protein
MSCQFLRPIPPSASARCKYSAAHVQRLGGCMRSSRNIALSLGIKHSQQHAEHNIDTEARLFYKLKSICAELNSNVTFAWLLDISVWHGTL